MGAAGAVEVAGVRAGIVGPPALPGVYAFRDGRGGLLYVGSSRCLVRRVASYFGARHPPASKVGRIARLAARLEWRTTGSVLEALVLEARTIGHERPHFNRRLKEPGRHLYVRFDPRDAYPRLELSRELQAGPWRYLGPFPGGRTTRVALERVVDALGLRTCADEIRPDPAGRACLRLDLGQCGAPCVGRMDAGRYGRQLTRALAMLGGGHPAEARALGARGGPSATTMPGPVAGALAAVRAARRTVRVVACVPAAGAPGHRLLGIVAGRLRAVVPLPQPDAAAAAFGRVLHALAVPPPLVLPREALDEVRIVTAWLASAAGRAAAVDLDRVGRRAALAWLEARLAPGPLFTTSGR